MAINVIPELIDDGVPVPTPDRLRDYHRYSVGGVWYSETFDQFFLFGFIFVFCSVVQLSVLFCAVVITAPAIVFLFVWSEKK